MTSAGTVASSLLTKSSLSTGHWILLFQSFVVLYIQIFSRSRGESEKELKVKLVVDKDRMIGLAMKKMGSVIEQRRRFQKLKENRRGSDLLADGITIHSLFYFLR